MVSRRGQNVKFSEGERVLCYEPDPTKAKVLYDSKVLEVSHKKDAKGRRTVEYLIHFQGWNSSWDRYVEEIFVLKDSDENRRLQKELSEKAQLLLKERRRKKPKLDDRKRGRVRSDSDNSCSKSANGNDSDKDKNLDEFDEDTTTEVTPVILDIPEYLKGKLEDDLRLIKQHKLLRLPAAPNVVSILEAFVKHQARVLASKTGDRNRANRRPSENLVDLGPSLTLCQEVADGVKVCFDFALPLLLLYDEERAQFKEALTLKPVPFTLPSITPDLSDGFSAKPHTAPAKRHLRSNRSQDDTSLKTKPQAENSTEVNHRSSDPTFENPALNEVLTTRLVPPEYYEVTPTTPSLTYGATHLLRLMVRLPDILSRMSLGQGQRQVVLQNCHLLLSYMASNWQLLDDRP